MDAFIDHGASPGGRPALQPGPAEAPSAAAAPFVVADAVSRIARLRPDAVALVAECGTLTYAELDGRASRLADWLRRRCDGAEPLVGLCLERSFDQLTAALAVWKAGGAFLPLDPAWPDARLRMIVEDAGCALVIGRPETAKRLSGVSAPVVALDWDAVAGELAVEAPAAAGPDALAYVIYTSGTTGTPKGVEVSHANLSHLIAWHNRAFDVGPDARASHLAGLGFDAAVWEVWPYLCAGASVVLVADGDRASPQRLRDALLDSAVTHAFAPTAIAQELLAADWPAETRLRWLLTGADRLLMRPRPGLPFAFVNNYGPTECTVVATSAVVDPSAEEELPPIGLPIAPSRIHILGLDGDPVEAGETGELFIGGPMVARGYRGRPELTAERFVADPFGAPGDRLYRTGDLGKFLPDGQIAFCGRTDDQVKIRGHRVEPDEVASALRRHPRVGQCAVIVRPGSDGADALAAYLVAEHAVTAEALRTFLAETLPDYMVPSLFVRIDALPINANGKLDKAALPEPHDSNLLAGASFAAPETAAEERLAEILAEVLGRGPVGVDDNFFLLGGHSLLGTQVVLRAGEAFGVELALRDLFLAPTIRQLGALIEAKLMRLIEEMSEDEAQQRAAE